MKKPDTTAVIRQLLYSGWEWISERMGSLLQSTLNTRALPVGNLRYIRSDYPGKLTEDEVQWLIRNNMETKDNLMEFLTSYVAEHPEVDINT